MKSLLTLLLLALPLQAIDIKLVWDANKEEEGIEGYKLSWGSIGGSYSNIISTANLSTVVSNVPPGTTYFAIKAINRDGVESPYSDEIVFTNALTSRFIVILSAGSIAQVNAVNEVLKIKGWEVCSKIDGTWLVMGEDITSRALAEELSKHPLIGGKVKLVIKIHDDGMTYWGNAPKEVWTWMAKFWGKSG